MTLDTDSWARLWATRVKPEKESQRVQMLMWQARKNDQEIACLAGLLRSTSHLTQE